MRPRVVRLVDALDWQAWKARRMGLSTTEHFADFANDDGDRVAVRVPRGILESYTWAQLDRACTAVVRVA